MNDIITLNVSGKKLQVKKDTLRASKYFTALFDRWTYDQEIFIDECPKKFKQLLDYMRYPENPKPDKNLQKMIDYYDVACEFNIRTIIDNIPNLSKELNCCPKEFYYFNVKNNYEITTYLSIQDDKDKKKVYYWCYDSTTWRKYNQHKYPKITFNEVCFKIHQSLLFSIKKIEGYNKIVDFEEKGLVNSLNKFYRVEKDDSFVYLFDYFTYYIRSELDGNKCMVYINLENDYDLRTELNNGNIDILYLKYDTKNFSDFVDDCKKK